MTADPPLDEDDSNQPSDGVGPNIDNSSESGTENGERRPPRYAPPPQEEFDWRGWTLVGIILVSFLIIPAAILYLQQAQEFVTSLGLSLRQAYLVLPMIPAILLGITAIWAAVRSRSARE